MAIKNKLLELRLQMGYKKQKDFAEFLEIDSWLYNRYENNAVQPGSEALLCICIKTGKRIEEVIYKVP
ncbi:helix-turn-helix domain-containing protein [Clostridium sp. ZS2-4]|uniref:helix-turn-helix domain-containing protein n=1 Tax=Clostridium sp. ZS2-4 TaxID=2987703 RepID=UPI00227C2911|nr:helix-turn-helix transcriptional regulator [Clostridium sp. ZS2-4]MCY6355359.1 helix-turn-helix transcriptional regulator [Clostridium sp. ZS2-4]